MCVHVRLGKCAVWILLQGIVVVWLSSCVSGLLVTDISLCDVREVCTVVDCLGLHPWNLVYEILSLCKTSA